MKKYIISACLLFLCVTLASAQKVEIAEKKAAEIEQTRTFFVRDGDLVLVMPSGANESELKEQIRKSIRADLLEKGYQDMTDSTADLSVSFVAEIVERTEQENLGPLGQAPARTGADLDQPRTWTQNVRTGSLAIEVFDAKSNKSLWRSKAEINFRSSDLNEVLNAAVSRSLRKFPKSRK